METVTRLPAADIARICYDTVRAHQAAWGDPMNPPWERAGAAAQASAVAAVDLGVREPDPAVRHDAWVRARLAGGWTPGAVKDPDAKVSPWLVPYCDLPARARERGLIYAALARALG